MEEHLNFNTDEVLDSITKESRKNHHQNQESFEVQLSFTTENDIRFESLENFNIPEDSIVKVKETSQGMLIIFSKFRNTGFAEDVVRINKDEYIVVSTGEIRKYRKSDTKSNEAISKSMSRLNDIILLNFNERTKSVFLTLTLDKNHRDYDLEEFKKITSNFFRNLEYKYRKLYNLAYVIKFERQLDGTWHSHVLIKDTNNKDIVFEKQHLDSKWSIGFAYIEKVNNDKRKASRKDVTSSIKNVTNYMTKRTQLFDIPRNARLYITSNNIEIPKAKTLSIKEIDTSESNLVLEDTFGVYKGDRLLNVNKRMLYNKKKTKRKSK